MRIPRLLLPSLLISLSMVAVVAAQSPSDKSADSSQLAPTSLRTPLDSSTSDRDLTPFPFTLSPSTKFGGEHTLTLHILTLEQDEKTCYTLRTYRVARETPDSDTTRPAGYSTCQRSTRFQLKTAVDSQQIAPR